MGRMYSRLEEDELPSSPPSTRKGLPSTISCVAEPCLRRCGSEEGCATQMGPGQAAAKTQTTAKTTIQRWRNSLSISEISVGADLCVCPGPVNPPAPGQTHRSAPTLCRLILDLLSLMVMTF